MTNQRYRKKAYRLLFQIIFFMCGAAAGVSNISTAVTDGERMFDSILLVLIVIGLVIAILQMVTLINRLTADSEPTYRANR